MGYSLWDCKESDTTEQLHFLSSSFTIPEALKMGIRDFGQDCLLGRPKQESFLLFGPYELQF